MVNQIRHIQYQLNTQWFQNYLREWVSQTSNVSTKINFCSCHRTCIGTKPTFSRLLVKTCQRNLRNFIQHILEEFQLVIIIQLRSVSRNCFNRRCTVLIFWHPIFFVKWHIHFTVPSQFARVYVELDVFFISIHCRHQSLLCKHTVHILCRNSEHHFVLGIRNSPNNLRLLNNTVNIERTYQTFQI